MEASVVFIGKVVVILVGIASIVGVISRVYLGHSSQSYKRVELYQQLQKLCGRDASTNLAEILVILRLFTRADLTNKEIEWFIWTPGAFRHLQEYGKKIEFIDIDYEKDSFKWRGKFDSSLKRNAFLSFLFIAYFTLGVVGVIFMQFASMDIVDNVYIEFFLTVALGFGGAVCFILAYISLIKSLILLPWEYLIDTNLRGDRADEHVASVVADTKENKRRYIHL
ncbi:hypothetical protein [Pseudoalteromonas sp. BDTF-M6]|uniref:hypothetical protein n=1 Tax=Pseudoalteromonas sp. BDTF-M6 TaxID=2796132 RepID=UPI001BAEB776|nr:hypothetical protein [Pseudoalteromonas sp. BDTF-M6]MBS3796142.1 hypothetical protein [Pseudoalteromonas sp. BDTF-M6]